MTASSGHARRFPWHRWLQRICFAWAVVSTSWLVNSYRTRGVAPALLASDAVVAVRDFGQVLAFLPISAADSTGLVFLVGAGVRAEAYAPLLRPIAEKGYPVHVIRLPFRIAPLAAHKQAAVDRALAILANDCSARKWVVAGHSLGAALACRIALSNPPTLHAVVLIGTTHPKRFDLSQSSIAITKVYGTNDGVAPWAKIEANKALLPLTTTWIAIEGGNHSQFAHYGKQLFDGSATISREQQQTLTRAALLQALEARFMP